MLDVDHFKVLNDTKGHPEGDKVLQSIASTLEAHVRDTDMVGRYGGEEFVVVMPGSQSLEQVTQKAEDLRIKVFKLGITVSIGATVFREGESVADLYERVDGLLYQSKQNGRNRTTNDAGEVEAGGLNV